ncbi:MAG TPA: hypothetical protein VMU04_24120 [Candidatus Acidoferrum sp.]|nr:hypothetical protein [Candidatus Acidoferrum sp.]
MSTRRHRLAAFVDSLSKEMLSFCGPIFIAPGLKTYPGQMVANGTYSLIDTGQRRILVTCQHVWQAYLDYRVGNPEAVLAVNLGEGNANIAFAFPERHIIDVDPDLDLAVFDFEPGHLRVNRSVVVHQKDWFPIRHWPIPTMPDGEYVALMGFPGKRIRKDGMLCTFSTQVLPLKASGVGERQIYIFNEGENVQVFRDIKSWLGGLSGSPAYTLSKAGASLVGFVKSGFKQTNEDTDTNDRSLFAGSLSLTHARFLQRDGTLARS